MSEDEKNIEEHNDNVVKGTTDENVTPLSPNKNVEDADTFEDAIDMKEVEESLNMDSIQSLQTSEKAPIFAEEYHVQTHTSEQAPGSEDAPLQKENDGQDTGLPKKLDQQYAVDSSTNESGDVSNGSSDIASTAEDNTKIPVDVVGNSSAATGHISTASTNTDDQHHSKPAPSSSRSNPLSPKASDSAVPPLRSPSISSGFMGSLAGKLPGFHTAAAPISSPPLAEKKLPPNPPPAHTRKTTGPFSWLSRKDTSASKDSVTSPSAIPSHFMERRNTQASVGSDSDNTKRENDYSVESGLSSRNNLKDRFKLLRMREEAGIPLEEEAGEASIAALARSAGLTSPQNENCPSPGLPSPGSIATLNSNLPPGTVSGVTAGPAMAPEAVDWDLWQAVVYEGPAAVARTSPEELNKAIATGIPGTIRGVVWQVLAQSKNDELESVYRELVNRGTDKDRNSSSSSFTAFASNTSSSKDLASPASSIHSDDHNNLSVSGPSEQLRSSSPHKDDSEAIARSQAAALIERQRKAKEDTASLTKLEKTIRRDLGARTSFSKFAASAGLQDGLFGICKAYALFDEGVGYAQGMNFLVMPLLFNMPEEEAFCLLVRLMNQYHLRDLFIQDMPGLHMHLYQFERLLEDLEPALYCHLKRRQVSPHLYATQWFLTLFAYRFPLQLVLRIYDLILSEGLEAILKFGIVLMQKNVAFLLAINDMGNLTSFLRDKLFDTYIDQSPSAGSILDSGFFGNAGASIDKEVYRADMLVQDACAVNITPAMLKTYAAEWEDKMRLEKGLAMELETLKSSNTSLTLKVRRLEERVQEHDSEHAALATELVRTKVENEELKDENESLKGQVSELRNVVEKQPGEVEDRLKQEMDRLMLRNQEVHTDNTRLEEELVDMEKNLVQTKMAFAEIKEENENIKQRLSNMRKALE